MERPGAGGPDRPSKPGGRATTAGRFDSSPLRHQRSSWTTSASIVDSPRSERRTPGDGRRERSVDHRRDTRRWVAARFPGSAPSTSTATVRGSTGAGGTPGRRPAPCPAPSSPQSSRGRWARPPGPAARRASRLVGETWQPVLGGRPAPQTASDTRAAPLAGQAPIRALGVAEGTPVTGRARSMTTSAAAKPSTKPAIPSITKATAARTATITQGQTRLRPGSRAPHRPKVAALPVF